MIKLTETQQQVFDCDAKIRVVSAGRRWGKSELAIYEATEQAISGNDVIIFCSSYHMCRNIFDKLADNFEGRKTGAIFKTKGDERKIELKNGARIVVDIHVGLRLSYKNKGDNFDFVVLDEMACHTMFDSEDWNATLDLLKENGRILALSTPNDINYFWDLYIKGLCTKDCQSFKFSTFDNNFIDPENTKEWEKRVPKKLFEQECFGEFLYDLTTVSGILKWLIERDLDASDKYHNSYEDGGDPDYCFHTEGRSEEVSEILKEIKKANG